MGTPEFAVPSLDLLVASHYAVAAVVTSPDKPAGRGQKVQFSAVKQFALAHHIPVLQPEKLKDPEFLDQLKGFQPDLQIVVAFRMLPEIVWGLPPLGTFNLHASLLPQYRGAAPINRVIMNGERETGLTTFFLDKEIDTGKIIKQWPLAIGDQETAGELHDRMMTAGAALVLETVNELVMQRLHPMAQQEVGALKTAPKIFKEDCQINWKASSETIHNQIRGLSPYPTAFTYLNEKMLKIYASAVQRIDTNHPAYSLQPGESFITKSGVGFRTLDGLVNVQLLQIEGKKKMTTDEFLRGYKG